MQVVGHQRKSSSLGFAECSSNWRDGSWFYALRSGIRIKGSKTRFTERVDSEVVIPPQVGFIFLISGSMNLELGGKSYQFHAGSEGCCIMFSLAQPEHLRRIALAGEINEHIGATGLEQWLIEDIESQVSLKQLYKVPVRSWPMTLTMHQGCQQWSKLNQPGNSLQRDLYGISLIESTWRHFLWLHEQAHMCSGYQRSMDLEPALDALLKAGIFDASRLAEGVNMSLRTLQRRAKEQFGFTLKDWLNGRRMLIAQRAMIEQGATISEAGWLAGYHHSSSFIQAFRKTFKTTPKAYLAQHLELVNSK